MIPQTDRDEVQAPPGRQTAGETDEGPTRFDGWARDVQETTAGPACRRLGQTARTKKGPDQGATFPDPASERRVSTKTTTPCRHLR
jgi:hypothetical protein